MHNILRSIFLRSILLPLGLLVACGGGSNSGAPIQPTQTPTATPQATVELLSSVIRVSEAESINYSSTAGIGELAYSGKSAPPIGSVIIVRGTAYKVAAITATSNGTILLTTKTPDFQEVFKKLLISTQFSLASAQSQYDGRRALATFSLPDAITLKPALPTPLELTGSLKSGKMTVNFDYEFGVGVRVAKVLLEGDLTASARLRVKVDSEGGYKEFAAFTPIVIPVPASLGTLSLNLPISVFVRNKAGLAIELARWDSTWGFTAGAEYDPNTKSFTNLSSLQDKGTSNGFGERSLVESALQTISGSIPVQKTTVASIVVGPVISPRLSALNDSVGVIGIRHEIGLKAALDVLGRFPTIIDCAQIPLSLSQTAYAFLNYKRFDSLLDFEGSVETLEGKLFEADAKFKVFHFGACTPSSAYWAGSYHLTTADLSQAPPNTYNFLFENPTFSVGPAGGGYGGYFYFAPGESVLIFGSDLGSGRDQVRNVYATAWNELGPQFEIKIPIGYQAMRATRKTVLVVESRTPTTMSGSVRVDTLSGKAGDLNNGNIQYFPSVAFGTWTATLTPGTRPQTKMNGFDFCFSDGTGAHQMPLTESSGRMPGWNTTAAGCTFN